MNDRVRVLEVLEATTAGVKQHVWSLVTRLDPQRFEVSVACPRVRENTFGDTNFVPDLIDAGIAVHVVPMRRRIAPMSDIRCLLQLERVIGQGYYQVVHTHSAKAGILGRLAAYRAATDARIIHTPHAFAFQSAAAPITRWLYRSVERLASRWTDRLICVSESEAELARSLRLASDGQLAVIPNGIDVTPFRHAVNVRAVRGSLGLDPQAAVIGTVGRLSRQKGLTYLIRAVAELIKHRSSVCLVIVGDGELRCELENLTEGLGLADRTHFLGFRNDIPEILMAFNVFVLSSLYEGLPYTLLEAMAAGKPVVATDVVGSRDCVLNGETGLLVPPRDPKALADAICEVLDHRGWADQMGANGKHWVERAFCVEHMVAATAELYESVASHALCCSPGQDLDWARVV